MRQPAITPGYVLGLLLVAVDTVCIAVGALAHRPAAFLIFGGIVWCLAVAYAVWTDA